MDERLRLACSIYNYRIYVRICFIVQELHELLAGEFVSFSSIRNFKCETRKKRFFYRNIVPLKWYLARMNMTKKHEKHHTLLNDSKE